MVGDSTSAAQPSFIRRHSELPNCPKLVRVPSYSVVFFKTETPKLITSADQMSGDIHCYSCHKEDDGPVCTACWAQQDGEQRDIMKRDYNYNCHKGDHGPGAQLYCDMPGCWGLVKKKISARGGTRCHEHFDKAADRCRPDRSRSPVRLRRSDNVASSRRATRVFEAIGQFRAGLIMMQNAIRDIEDATINSQ